MIFRNKTSYAFKEAHLSESITLEIFDLWGSFFFQNIENFIVNLKVKKNAAKNLGFVR